ncbi:MAG: hypothetical protein IJ532_06585 [Alphaproteobacteria bacterium]|nr:hypothetical protein [Alphaproteobacteria bacterium]
MELNELWNAETAGIGLVIDDELDDKKSKIYKIVKNLQSHNIPLLLYKELPNDKLLNNLNSISFIILDWELSNEFKKLQNPNLTPPSNLLNKNINKNVEFLNYISNNVFCPVFILSNEGVYSIRSYLKEKGLINDNQTNFIFVKSKSTSLSFESIQSNIQKWIKKNPPLYVLHMYENALAKAKNETFSTFYNLSKSWPIALYQNAKADEIDYSSEIFNTIIKNVETRIPYLILSEDIFESKAKIKKEELQKVIEGQTFIENKKLKSNDIDTGDIFLGKNSGEDVYYINIRPTCNLRPQKGETVDDVKLYLLRGEEYEIPSDQKSIGEELKNDAKQGHSYYKIYCLYNGKHIKFRFKNLSIKSRKQLKKDCKAERIGRIIPPYITELRSKYTAYLNRQGLPRIPFEIKDF